MNLSKYITNWLFVHNLSWMEEITSIVYESFDNRDVLENSPSIDKVTTIKKIWFKNLKSHIENNKKTILVLDKLSLEEISDYSWNNKVIIIEPYWAISSIDKKFNTLKNDISLALDKKLKVIFPYDLWNLINNMTNFSNLYIKVSDKEYPSSLIGEHQSNNWLINLSAFWYAWTEATILCSGDFALEITMAYNHMNESTTYDLFLIQDAMFKRVDTLENSININKKVILIIDQEPESKYIKDFIDELMLKKIKKNNIHIITPHYNNIKTNIWEYMLENSWFDSIWLNNNIEKVVKVQ